MTRNLHKDSPIPAYMAYPRFLLTMDISETAKLVYVLLLDRARLSMKNKGWEDEQGHVFIYYTIADLASASGKSEMTVKNDGVQHDYTRKQGLVWQQIFLPEYAPAEWSDRGTLLAENGQWQYKTEKEYLCVRDGEEMGFTGAEFKQAQKEGWEKQYQYKVGRKKEYMVPSVAEAAETAGNHASKAPQKGLRKITSRAEENLRKTGGFYENRAYQEAKDNRHILQRKRPPCGGLHTRCESKETAAEVRSQIPGIVQAD